MQQTNYRNVLRDSLSKRLAVNPRYSLRAFARDLDISVGQLSLVLGGKRGISPKKASLIFETLGLSQEERKLYLLQVAKEHARSPRDKEKASKSLAAYSEDQSHLRLTQDAFDVISEWYYLSILQSLSLASAPKTNRLKQIKWISSKLNLPEIEIKLAFERLERLELVRVENNLYMICHDTVFTSEGVPSSAVRQFHKQILQKAISAIEIQSIDERYPNTSVLPIKKSSFPVIKEEIKKFQKMILKKHGRNVQADADAVYAISVQLFKLAEN